MCIKCKNREMAADMLANFLDTSDALLDAFGLIERLKARGATLDPDEQKCYDRLSRFVRAEDGEAESAGPPAGIMEALQAAFPGATIVAGTPEQIEAQLEASNKGKKSTH